MNAVLLAAGFATRMYPLTRDFPKPLLEVGGKPILTHLLERVERVRGLGRVCVVTNARFLAAFERWSEGVPEGAPRILMDDGAMEPEHRLGALGDLRLALDRIGDDDDVLVIAGDNLIDFELEPLHRDFERERAPMILVREAEGTVPPRRHGEATLREDGSVASFREKPDAPGSRLLAIAIYFLPAGIAADLDTYLRAGGNPDAPGYFLEWLVARRRVVARRIPGRWFDIGDLDSLARAREAWSIGS